MSRYSVHEPENQRVHETPGIDEWKWTPVDYHVNIGQGFLLWGRCAGCGTWCLWTPHAMVEISLVVAH